MRKHKREQNDKDHGSLERVGDMINDAADGRDEFQQFMQRGHPLCRPSHIHSVYCDPDPGLDLS